jgi:hypothetical protein
MTFQKLDLYVSISEKKINDSLHYLRIQNIRNLEHCAILAVNNDYRMKDLHEH